MIDIHCHILPGIDDGACDLAMSLAMARLAVADGITAIVCTPHVTPGLYDNSTDNITNAVETLRLALADTEIALELCVGADVHIAPDLVRRLSEGEIPTIAGGDYFLFEPSHDVPPPHLVDFCQTILASGLHPVLTHPERLAWIEGHYNIIEELCRAGVVMQVTAGSITGDFGKRPRYWAERMLEEDRVDILATDAHNITGRPPVLSKARDVVAARLGDKKATFMVEGGPAMILGNLLLPAKAIRPASIKRHKPVAEWLSRWMENREHSVDV
jgi:protein-tyrosine phosphatase